MNSILINLNFFKVLQQQQLRLQPLLPQLPQLRPQQLRPLQRRRLRVKLDHQKQLKSHACSCLQQKLNVCQRAMATRITAMIAPARVKY
jgi:hypothetical protein